MSLTYADEQRSRAPRLASNSSFTESAPPQQGEEGVSTEGQRPRSSASLNYTGRKPTRTRSQHIIRHNDDNYQFAEDVARFYGIDSYLCKPVGNKLPDETSPNGKPAAEEHTQAPEPNFDKKAYNYNIINLHDVDTGQVYQYLVPVTFDPNVLNLSTSPAEPSSFPNVDSSAKTDPEFFEIPQPNHPAYYCSNCEICTNLRNQQHPYRPQLAPADFLQRHNPIKDRLSANLGYYEMSPNIKALNLKTFDIPPSKMQTFNSGTDPLDHNIIKALNLRSSEACHNTINGYFERPPPRIIGTRNLQKNLSRPIQEPIIVPKPVFLANFNEASSDQASMVYPNYDLAYADKLYNPRLQLHCFLAQNKDNAECFVPKTNEPCSVQNETPEPEKVIQFIEAQNLLGSQQVPNVKNPRSAFKNIEKRYHSGMLLPKEINLIQDYYVKDTQLKESERNFVAFKDEEMGHYDHLYSMQEPRSFQPIAPPRGYFVHVPKAERAPSNQMYSMQEASEYQDISNFPSIPANYRFKSFNQIETEYLNRFVPESPAADPMGSLHAYARDRNWRNNVAISKSSECIIFSPSRKRFQISRGVQPTGSMMDPNLSMLFTKKEVEPTQVQLEEITPKTSTPADKWQENPQPAEEPSNKGIKEQTSHAEVGSQQVFTSEPIGLKPQQQAVKMLRLQAVLPRPLPILVKPPSGMRHMPAVNQGGFFHPVRSEGGDRFV